MAHNSLSTVADVQRYVAACVRYANETSEYTYRVEFDNFEDTFRELVQNGVEPRQAEKQAKTGRYYTYRKGNEVVIHVPNPSTAMSERDVKIIKAGTLHEILHTSQGTHDAQQEILDSGIGKLGERDKLAHIFNVVEDHRIERLDCEKFEGDAHVLREAYEILSSEFADHVRNDVDTSKLEDDTLKIMGLKVMDLIARETWMNLGHVTAEQIEVNPPVVNEVASALVDKGFDERLSTVETVTEAIHLSKEIFNELFDADAEEHIEQNARPDEQNAQEQESGESDGGESGESQEGEGTSAEDGGQKADGPQESDGQGPGEEKGVRKVPDDDHDFLTYINNKKSIPDTGSSPPEAGIHIDYSKYLESKQSFDSFDPCPMDQIGVANFGADKYIGYGEGNRGNTKGMVSRVREGHSGIGPINRVFDSHGTQVNALANKIRRKLQVKSQARWVGGSTSGRIHRKSAYRAAMPTVGDGRWNREIFKRRHQDDTLDVAVSVLCDFSGSMGGDKMAHATFGGFILGDAVGRVLRVPVQVQTFSEVSQSTVICVLKNWNEIVSAEEFKKRAARACNTMNQNDDGSAILWTYENLRRRPEKRKVMIVLSDGSPASSREGDEMEYTQRIVNDIQQEGKVEMYGIGIMDRNVRHIYKEYETINGADEIESAILNTVQRKLIV